MSIVTVDKYFNYLTQTYVDKDMSQYKQKLKKKSCLGKCDTCSRSCDRQNESGDSDSESEYDDIECGGIKRCLECQACECDQDIVGDTYQVRYESTSHKAVCTYYSFICKKCGFDPYLYTSVKDMGDAGKSRDRSKYYLCLVKGDKNNCSYDEKKEENFKLIKTVYDRGCVDYTRNCKNTNPT